MSCNCLFQKVLNLKKIDSASKLFCSSMMLLPKSNEDQRFVAIFESKINRLIDDVKQLQLYYNNSSKNLMRKNINLFDELVDNDFQPASFRLLIFQFGSKSSVFDLFSIFVFHIRSTQFLLRGDTPLFDKCQVCSNEREWKKKKDEAIHKRF